jgi:hypothetical protein
MPQQPSVQHRQQFDLPTDGVLISPCDYSSDKQCIHHGILDLNNFRDGKRTFTPVS